MIYLLKNKKKINTKRNSNVQKKKDVKELTTARD
jgi:hypothetical protein